jgi:predicted nucleic acid-binding protein
VSAFADSSALVKLYANEDRSDDVRDLAGPLYVSALARVEVTAALWRKNRSGELSRAAAQTLAAEFAADFHGVVSEPPRFLPVAPVVPLLDLAADLTDRYGLRAYDAIQLASAVAVRRIDNTCRVFACFDKGLSSAADSEGFTTPFTR